MKTSHPGTTIIMRAAVRVAASVLLLAAAAAALAQGGAIKFDPFKSPFPQNSYEQIGARLKELIEAMDWGDGVVAMMVQDADYPLNAFEQNSNRPMETGALLQLVTAAAALDVLGPEFRFTTTLGISGAVEDHELRGSVIVRGDGDPTLSARGLEDPEDAYGTFDKWAKALRKQGIKKVNGGVIADDKAFDTRWHAPGWPVEGLGGPDLPSIGALNFNDNCVDIFWQKTKKDGAVPEYIIFPLLPDYVFVANQVKAAAAGQAGRRYTRERDTNVIEIAGTLPLKTEAHDRAAIEDPGKFFAEALKARLIDRGVKVEGATGSVSKLSVAGLAADVRELDKLASPPLRNILGDMLRYNLALHAETVFKAMGRQTGGGPGTWENGQEAVRGWVDRQRLQGATWPFSDGSGRSRMDRISPAQLLGVMRAARRGAFARTYESLLPRAWDTGVMANRLRPPGEAGKKPLKKTPPPPVWGVCGSGEGFEGLAGYADSRFQRRLVFAVMVAGSRLPVDVLRQQIDALVLEITK